MLTLETAECCSLSQQLCTIQLPGTRNHPRHLQSIMTNSKPHLLRNQTAEKIMLSSIPYDDLVSLHICPQT
ncbi:hypothetical protein VNO77_43005 [Canavalia gladiata]|uniref:Uncharacterized protein n=1 Tax=Canavalia gladiata TaxID=3824 RepID=A0AAN9PMJ9_CANGL